MSCAFSDWYKVAGKWYTDCVDTTALLTGGPDTVRMSLAQVYSMRVNDPDAANRTAAEKALERRYQVYCGDPLKEVPPSHKKPPPEKPADVLPFRPKDLS